MFYTIYQVVNKINGKVYMGKHVTENLDDGYMGSGKLIRLAIKKYGRDNFFKTIIAVYCNENLMNAAEKFLVAYDPDTTYNLCEGGKGGWGYVNHIGLNGTLKALEKRKELEADPDWKKNWKDKHLDGAKNRKALPKDIRSSLTKQSNEKYKQKHGRLPFEGKKHTSDAKNRIGEKNSKNMIGEKNSQYGTMWITNGSENRKIKKLEMMPDGWRRGRVQVYCPFV